MSVAVSSSSGRHHRSYQTSCFQLNSNQDLERPLRTTFFQDLFAGRSSLGSEWSHRKWELRNIYRSLSVLNEEGGSGVSLICSRILGSHFLTLQRIHKHHSQQRELFCRLEPWPHSGHLCTSKQALCQAATFRIRTSRTSPCTVCIS